MAGPIILVGLDGSDSAHRAAAQACELAALLDARVVLAYSVRLDLPPYDTSLGMATDAVGEFVRFGERLLEQEKARLATRVPITTEVLLGAPGEMLAGRAEAEDVRWVFVGRSGRGAVSRFLVGSVANRLSHLCPKPLVIVP
jgi:nucleotide-binding universal stress UspA family protein